MSKATHLECSVCGTRFEAGQAANLCSCGGPLLVRYDLDKIRHRWLRREVPNGPASMWRYAPVLPPADEAIVSLGEGWTPLIRTKRLGARVGADALWVKDEGMNPTASFKARGLSCAISMCVELGIKKVAIPSAGNAASALAAYAAAAGMESYIFMPRDVPQANYLECKAYGANVTLVDGLISDCGKIVAERGPEGGLVRHQHAEGALPHRRQEDHGLRSGRADGLGTARRHLLSHRRRRGPDRHVEGLRRNGEAGLDRRQAAQDDRGAGGRLRARSSAHSKRTSRAATSSRMPTRWPPGCACPKRWAISWCCKACAKAAARRWR